MSLVDRGARLPRRRVERRDLTVRLRTAVDSAEDRFRRALGDEEPATAGVRRLDDDRQTAALEVERDFVDLPIARRRPPPAC